MSDQVTVPKELLEVVAWQDAENQLYTTGEKRQMHGWATDGYPIVELVRLSDATAVIDQLRERVAELEYAAELDRTADLYAAPQPAAQDRWIPVSERLPEIATDVLVYGVNHGSASYTVAGLFSGSWASQETEETTRFEPTHWMPLPAVPEVRS